MRMESEIEIIPFLHFSFEPGCFYTIYAHISSIKFRISSLDDIVNAERRSVPWEKSPKFIVALHVQYDWINLATSDTCDIRKVWRMTETKDVTPIKRKTIRVRTRFYGYKSVLCMWTTEVSNNNQMNINLYAKFESRAIRFLFGICLEKRRR